MKMTRAFFGSMMIALASTFAFGGCAAEAVDQGSTPVVAAQSDVISMAQAKLAEPDAVILRAFVEARGYRLDAANATLLDVGNHPILGVPFVANDGTVAHVAFGLGGNDTTQRLVAAMPVGGDVPDDLFIVEGGSVVPMSELKTNPSEEQYGCCMAEVAFGCYLSCLGKPVCCAPICCCGPGSC